MMMTGNYLKEACVESYDQSIRAERQGADRIELCADLANDGLTPSESLIRRVKETLKIPVRVMVRPRAGDFIYSDQEIDQMKRTITLCKEIGVEGVVFGICTKENQLDLSTISYLAAISKPLKVTIHKAIDTCDDPVSELLKLKTTGVTSVLTSGKAATAKEGVKVLQEMVSKAAPIELIACGKVTRENLDEIHQMIGASAYHGKKIVGDLA